MTDRKPDQTRFDTSAVGSAQVVVSVRDFAANLTFFRDRLGFRLDAIYPADHPRRATLSGYGLMLALRQAERDDVLTLRLILRGSAVPPNREAVEAPNGSRIEFAAEEPTIELPDNVPEFVLSKLDARTPWGEGRAGMRYRDLIPNRQGGRFIASHIRIVEPGPVPDYVHFHRVRFQLIYCYKGWARLVYEDQGKPFIMRAGDCVLQPPQIRHQVLESGDGLEVVEVACPADHETLADPSLALPTGNLDSSRQFAGQRFVFHQARKAQWSPWRMDGFEARDLGIAAATDGLLSAQVVRPRAEPSAQALTHHGEFLFLFVLGGGLQLDTASSGVHRLTDGDCVTIPAAACHRLSDCDPSLEF
ncbi:MAG TPA: cupin domain-containing protein, partial [Candidatus Krumholzibacteria bacterium]